MKLILFKYSISLTPDQIEYLKPLIEAYNEMLKTGRSGSIIAQVFPEGEVDKIISKFSTLPKIDFYIVPRYKMKMVFKQFWKKPSGLIKRIDYFKKTRKAIERIKSK